MASTATQQGGLRAIALFEAAKGVLALLAAAGLHLIGPARLRHAIDPIAHALRLPPEAGASGWLARALSPESLHLATVLAVVYALLRLTEAWGLWRDRAWAVWFGTLSCAAYIPFEATALLRHPHWLTAIVLLINLLVVWVLGRNLWRRREALRD
ncbi:MAG: DUF2127 domain-containing protein [Pseudomonadota bacterium]|nr:DUF2127 domain-containing protein [Pseudomonadota bacterium]